MCVYYIYIYTYLSILHTKSQYLHAPRVGTDIIGPGEAVFAVRCMKFKQI